MTDWGAVAGKCTGIRLTTPWCVSEQPLPTHSCDTTLHGLTYILGDPGDLVDWGRTPHHIHLRP